MDKRGKPAGKTVAGSRAKPGAIPRAKPVGGAPSLAAGAPSPWSVPVTVDHMPEDGLHRAIAASDAECAGVAMLAAVRAVFGLSADLDVIRDGDLVHVSGQVCARVGQNCVVTLEPIETDVDEPIDITFTAVAEDADGLDAGKTDGKADIKADGEPPEPLINGTVDLGAIATEFLVLGIDPYPRKAGVEFTPPTVADETPHPFAALAALKKRPGGGEP